MTTSNDLQREHENYAQYNKGQINTLKQAIIHTRHRGIKKKKERNKRGTLEQVIYCLLQSFCHSRMRRVTALGRVCLSVCPVRVLLTSESFALETSCLVRSYVFRTSIGQDRVPRSRGQCQGQTSVTKHICICKWSAFD